MVILPTFSARLGTASVCVCFNNLASLVTYLAGSDWGRREKKWSIVCLGLSLDQAPKLYVLIVTWLA